MCHTDILIHHTQKHVIFNIIIITTTTYGGFKTL